MIHLLGRHTAALALLLVLLGPPAACAQDGGSRLLWRISRDGQGAGYLVGSVQMMPQEAYPLSDLFNEAFAEAGVLVTEVNLDSLIAQGPALSERGAYADTTRSLRSVVSDETMQALERTLSEEGINPQIFEGLKPWAAALALTSIQLQLADFQAYSGIDAYFFRKAKGRNTERLGLEPATATMDIFERLSPRQQEAFLKYNVAEAGEAVEEMSARIAAWRRGDLQPFAEDVEEMQQAVPFLYDALIAGRTQQWMPQIDELLRSDHRPFIVLDTDHLVGPQGLLEMLQANDYDVARL